MSKIDDIKVRKLIHSMALKYNMSDEEMKNLVNSPYEFTHDKMKTFKLNEIETREQLNNTKTNFIFRSFFKIVVDWHTIKGKKHRKNNINKINNK